MSTTRTFEQGKAVLMACIMTAAIIVSNSVAAFETSGQGSPESIEYCSIIKDPRLTNEEKVRLDEVTKAYELSVNC